MTDHDDRKDPHETAGAEAGAPPDRIAALEADLAAAREEARAANDRWVRERADLENVKRRAQRERGDAVRYGNEALVKDLLPVVDNLERALKATGAAAQGALVEGVGMVVKSLLDVLERHGVTRIASHGAAFDPAHHEAVAHVESAEHPPNAVIEEHQPGYRLHERLLRPALVTVAKGNPNLANPQGGD
ncbi:MAG: nucleotide exchange factor GrpE [bacterium]|nr:nucleotide exchange factor GrpE [bacterium]